jgi:hypothetical protein
MSSKKKAAESIVVRSILSPAQLLAIDEGERRRREYLATLDPRQREMLDPKED